MAERNGTALAFGQRRRLRVVPETHEYEVERGDEVTVLTGYVAGDRCPVPVSIEVQAAVDAYNAIITAIDPQKPDLTAYRRAQLTQRRDILLAVLRGLTHEEADVMAADGGDWQDILVELGWWNAPAAEDAEEDADDPEAEEARASTTDASSPASASTTPASIS
jgi:hypothetical protein